MFLLSMAFGQSQYGNLYLNKVLGLYLYGSASFHPYQLISHMFMHGNIGHIFFNMFALVMFGMPLERAWGSKRFITFYLVTGFGAALLHQGVSLFRVHQLLSDLSSSESQEILNLVKNQGSQLMLEGKNYTDALLGQVNAIYNTPVVGASGAVFGILLGFGMLFPNTELIFIFFPIPVKAKYFVILYGAFELFSGITNQPGDNVAHFAHLGGMIFGFFMIKYWQKTDRQNFY
jgi:membrane associated rhomboid family serine protease